MEVEREFNAPYSEFTMLCPTNLNWVELMGSQMDNEYYQISGDVRRCESRANVFSSFIETTVASVFVLQNDIILKDHSY